MRSQGISDYPDPTSGGGLTFPIGGVSDLNPTSPAFQAAERACRKYNPGAAGVPTGARLTQDLNHLLHYAQCMRAHGITNFPDPTVNPLGGPGFRFTQDVDQSSPMFLAADRVCHHLLPGGGEGHGP